MVVAGKKANEQNVSSHSACLSMTCQLGGDLRNYFDAPASRRRGDIIEDTVTILHVMHMAAGIRIINRCVLSLGNVIRSLQFLAGKAEIHISFSH